VLLFEGERDSVDGYQQSSGLRVCVLDRFKKAGVRIIIVMFASESGLGIGCFGQAIALERYHGCWGGAGGASNTRESCKMRGRAGHPQRCSSGLEKWGRESPKRDAREDGVNPMAVNILVHSAWGAKAPVVLRTYQTA
jgi:hypothetical protein